VSINCVAVSADLEYGAGMHVTNGTVFPRQMGIGATRDLGAAAEVAIITAIESRATGFNGNYSPVADVNTIRRILLLEFERSV
jgi:beta-N-acetylhexosaminidase